MLSGFRLGIDILEFIEYEYEYLGYLIQIRHVATTTYKVGLIPL